MYLPSVCKGDMPCMVPEFVMMALFVKAEKTDGIVKTAISMTAIGIT